MGEDDVEFDGGLVDRRQDCSPLALRIFILSGGRVGSSDEEGVGMDWDRLSRRP